MQPLKALLVVSSCAAVLAASAAADNPPPYGAGEEAKPGLGPPKIPSDYSRAVAKAMFAHGYDTAWSYLHPLFQKAVSEARWRTCQRTSPVAPPGVKISKVNVADSRVVPIRLPLLGLKSTQQVTLQVLFTSSAGNGLQVALEYAYWVKEKGKWFAVWLAPTYELYKAGECGTPLARGLY